MRVVVTGTGVVSPLGDSRRDLHAGLMAGRSGFLPLPELAFDGHQVPAAAAVADFDPERYLGEVNLRPLDRIGRLAASAARLALVDAGLDEGAGDRQLGLVLGTAFGGLRTVAQFDRRGLEAGPLYVRPFDFANCVIHAAAGQTAIHHRLRGLNTTVSSGSASGAQALALAADLVASGQAEVVLAGGAEELGSETLFAFARSGLLARNGAPRPFDARRSGFLLGEGAACLVLEAAEAAAARGARPLAEILGHGASFDPSQGGDEGCGARAVARAVEAALAEAGLVAEAIAGVSAAASGAVATDRREAMGLALALGRHAAAVPLSAPKGLLGEALGASGALQAVALVAAMEAGELPGIPGLEQPDPDFPLSAGSPEPRIAELPVALLEGVERDGHCCSVLLGRPRPA